MKVAQHSPHPKTQQTHRQGHLIQAHIPPLSNCIDIEEEPSSLHNSTHTKHTHATREQNTTYNMLFLRINYKFSQIIKLNCKFGSINRVIVSL